MWNRQYSRQTLATLLLAGCSLAGADTFESFEVNTDPSPESFSVCYNTTCKEVAQLSLSAQEWQSVRDFFQPAPATPEEERRIIARVIGHMERLVAPQVNTGNDKAGNMKGIFETGNQQDCVDESTNSTTYITMMIKDGLIRWHTVRNRGTRGFFIFGWPHRTAVIRDTTTGQDWAVDSWFRDNGMDADIVPLEQWASGWSPENP